MITISSYHYFNLSDQGWSAKGWFNVVPEEDVNESAYNDDSAKWFYAENDGDLVKSEIKTISSKKYAFNNKGEMLSGVQALALSSSTKNVGNKAIMAIPTQSDQMYMFTTSALVVMVL